MSGFRCYPTTCRHRREARNVEKNTNLDAHVRSRRTDEPERRTDVHLDDDVESIIWCSEQHTIVGETSVVDDVV